MNRPTIHEVRDIAIALGTVECPRTRNKGAAGILLEKLTGIPQSSTHIDCSDGEVEVFPLKRKVKGELVPKETIAVTMMNAEKLEKEDDFVQSGCGTKLKRMLIIPYLREGNFVTFYRPIEFFLEGRALEELKKDYDGIRDTCMKTGILESRIGTYMQSRTKGAGRSARKTRAFYLKKEFINEFLVKTW